MRIRRRSTIGLEGILSRGLEGEAEEGRVRARVLLVGLRMVEREREVEGRCLRRRLVLRSCLGNSLGVVEWAEGLVGPLVSDICILHVKLQCLGCAQEYPADLVCVLTGGGMFGGPGFATFGGGGPGIRVHQFGGNRPRRRPHNHENVPPQTLGAALSSLLPILLLFLLPLLSSLFSGSGSSGPSIRLDTASPPHTLQHNSARLNVPYWVNPSEVQDYTSKKWKDLDKVAEGQFIGRLSSECEWEQGQRQRLANDAQGFFFTDMEKLNRARKMRMPSCEALKEKGYRMPY